MSVMAVILSVAAGALLGVLVDWLIKPFLPQQPTLKNGIVGVSAVIGLVVVLAVLSIGANKREIGSSAVTSIPDNTNAQSGERSASIPEPTSTFKVCGFVTHTTFQSLWKQYKGDLGCPTEVAHTISRTAEQAFEGGHMFWRKDTDDVYIIYDRNSNGTRLDHGNWTLNWREWKWDGSYPGGIGLQSPPGLFEPVRGFGWLWRTHYGGPDGRLGWAIDAEYGWDDLAFVQQFELGLIFRASDPRMYVLLDNGSFYASP
jgi:hypothetical protein